MRTPVSFWIWSIILLLASSTGAVGTAPGRLESVSILAAGAGSSLAVRTSAAATLVAATAADDRTVVIELVGITAEPRDLMVTDGTGIISRIAIDTMSPSRNGIVARIRVSLVRPYRHRLRISGDLVYVDFEPAGAPDVKPAANGTTNTANRPLQARAVKPPRRPAVAPQTVEVSGARSPMGVDSSAPSSAQTTEVNLLSRWPAITEPLRHTFSPPSADTVLARAWMPLVLKDGTIIFSYGDYAEVDEQITFLLPFDDSDTPGVEAVSLPRSAVDLEATARAVESVRAARYMLTRGPREFADLSQEVSTLLNTVPSQSGALARVSLVEGVRRRLIEWPASHYGYRASDVSEAVTMLDPVLIQLRAAAGVNRIDLSLVAPARVPSQGLTFRQPTLVDLIENAMRVVSVLKVPAERTAVLRTTVASLARHHAELPSVWLTTGRRRVETALKSETRIDEAYRQLSADIITSAVRAAARGNVRAISALQSDLLERDRRLGGKRQDVLSSTMAALRTQYESAAQVHLAREHRTMGVEAVRAYANNVEPALKRFDEVKPDLQRFDRIALASPKMAALRDALDFVKRTLVQCPPPPPVADAHGLLLTAVYLAGVALQESVDPRLSPDVARSVRSSAASEALIMFDRGRQEIKAVLRSR